MLEKSSKKFGRKKVKYENEKMQIERGEEKWSGRMDSQEKVGGKIVRKK